MPIQKRLMPAASLFVSILILYGVARYYSPYLVFHVVEHSLMQKAPASADAAQLRGRLHAFLAAVPDQGKKMERLLRISEYLEKVQYLAPEELETLLPLEGEENSKPRSTG
jgi:hypothetical protein